jgi:hypothetical protein
MPYVITTRRPGLGPLDPETAARDAIGLYREARDDGKSSAEAEALAMREVSDAVRATEEVPESVFRRAVATLEEAREQADDAVFAAHNRERKRPSDELPPPYMAQSIEARDLPESGGAVGPLPDGTVIEVEQLSPLMLAAHIPGDPASIAALLRVGLDRKDWSDLIDAFNARQS